MTKIKHTVQTMIRRAAVTVGALILTALPLLGQQPHAGHGTQPAPQKPTRPAAQASAATSQQLNAVLQRMLADPVIRERVATDPVLQRLMQTAGIQPPQGVNGNAAMAEMQGMNHANMQMGATVTRQDQQEALQFIARLLADPAIAEPIQDDGTLRRLWADPEVQRKLSELRTTHGTSARGTGHQHK